MKSVIGDSVARPEQSWPAGAAPLLSSKINLAAAAGNFATEAYQAGLVRFILFNRENNPYQIANGNSETLATVTGVSFLLVQCAFQAVTLTTALELMELFCLAMCIDFEALSKILVLVLCLLDSPDK